MTWKDTVLDPKNYRAPHQTCHNLACASARVHAINHCIRTVSLRQILNTSQMVKHILDIRRDVNLAEANKPTEH